MKICCDQDCNDIGIVIETKWRYYLFYLQQYISALGTVLPKSFTEAFSSNNFVYGDVVYAQTWEVLTLRNCIEPP